MHEPDEDTVQAETMHDTRVRIEAIRGCLVAALELAAVTGATEPWMLDIARAHAGVVDTLADWHNSTRQK